MGVRECRCRGCDACQKANGLSIGLNATLGTVDFIMHDCCSREAEYWGQFCYECEEQHKPR